MNDDGGSTDSSAVDDGFTVSDGDKVDVPKDGPSSPIRNHIGQASVHLMDWVHDNKILLRGVVIGGIASLTAYGFYVSPLFFRYRRISEIPRQVRVLHGQAVRAEYHNVESIRLYFQHLSPVHRWLPAGNAPTADAKDLLTVELAPPVRPPLYFYSNHYDPYSMWLQNWVESRDARNIRLEILDRRHGEENGETPTKRPIPNMPRPPTVLVGKVQYYPRGSLWSRLRGSDLSYDLVRNGRAYVSADASSSLREAQILAAMDGLGQWCDQDQAEKHAPDIWKEAQFRLEGPWYQKLWRWWNER